MIRIALPLCLFVFVAVANVALAKRGPAATQPYEAKFSKEWRLVSSSPKLEVWKMTVTGSAPIVSATLLDPKDAHMKPTRLGAGAGSENIAIESLKSFVAGRNAKLSAVGIRSWTLNAAKRAPSALQFQGTYVGPSGAQHCFVEKQATVGRQIVQITATIKSESACNWTELGAWLEQVHPTL